MRHILALLLVTATVAVGWSSSQIHPQEQDEAGFEAFHYGSIAEGEAFREVFLVHNVSSAESIPVAELEIRRNGVPLAVEWQAAGPILAENDTFAFVQEAFDTKQTLTAHWQGRQVMECAYGGGAGRAIHPDDHRAMGLPEEVRCLQLMDDQMGDH